jgi:CRP-like cAMP-binding protein
VSGLNLVSCPEVAKVFFLSPWLARIGALLNGLGLCSADGANARRTMDQLQVGTNAILNSLSSADLDLLTARSDQVALKLGVVLYEPGDALEHVYFPTSGMISVVTTMETGDAVETGIIGREGVSCSAVIGRTNAMDRGMVQATGSAIRVPVEVFLAAYDESKPFRDQVNRHNTLMWGMAQQTAACNAVHKLEARLARWLLQTRDLIGSDELPLTQEFLSMMLGVQRTTITLAEGILQDEHLITVRRGRVRLLDADGLSRRSCECYHRLRERQRDARSR